MPLLSPLAGPECRWAVARFWVFALRWIVALMILGVVLVVSWFCWFSNSLNPTFLPGDALRAALTITLGMTLACVLLLSPAVLAGTFASDSQLGTIGLLLSTRVSAGEIVFSRFLSRLCQVGIVTAAGLPGICLLAAYAGTDLKSLAVLLLLTTAVACGCGGIAMSFSVLFKRGRDALIGTYAFGLALLFLPMMVAARMPGAAALWSETLNPFLSLRPLIGFGQSRPAWWAILFWFGLAVSSVFLTSGMLRPTYMRRVGGSSSLARRRRSVPPMSDCPILWKELYIESDKDYGRVVRVLGRLFLFLMLGSSALLLTLFLWSRGNRQSPEVVEEILQSSAVWLASLMLPMSWLVQWGVGIRAAAGIATEKERGTWDALMMTPLESGQIVKAKMMESFYVLRWILVATLIVWLLGLLLEAVDFYGFVVLSVRAVVFLGFMSAVGVWSSLYAKTSGRAITLALASWLVGKIFFSVAAVLLVLIAMLGYYLIWAAFGLIIGRSSATMPQPLMSFEAAMTIFEILLCLGTAIAVAWYCRLRFDRLAGRCPARSMPVPLPVKPKVG